jgi:hypothetical protein
VSAERQAAIRELMRAAERALDVCGNEALGDDPRLASRILMFGTEDGARTRVVVELAQGAPMVIGELVRNLEGGRVERLPIFELHAAPPDASEGLH